MTLTATCVPASKAHFELTTDPSLLLRCLQASLRDPLRSADESSTSGLGSFHGPEAKDQATLHVHGGNGIKFTPKGGKTTDQKPPAVLTLSSGDSFVLRKKLFRFEYGTEDSLATYSTPTKGSATPLATPAKSVRRRASHRLSLVPNGKAFEPHTPSSKNRRKSVGPSKLSQNQEELEQSEVGVVEAEEGYKVYMEQTQEEEEQVEEADEHVSPVERFHGVASHSQESSVQATPVAPSTPPKPARMTAQVALTTPRGSGSLRKSLLLKSARKAWKETQSPGLEGAIENGNVQVRRKSLSPKVVSPVPLDESASEDEEEVEQVQGEVEMQLDEGAEDGPQEFEWVEEEGLDASMVESESDASFEANESLEIVGDAGTLQGTDVQPGQSVLTFTPPPKIRIEHESMQEGPETWQNEDEESERSEADEEMEPVEENASDGDINEGSDREEGTEIKAEMEVGACAYYVGKADESEAPLRPIFYPTTETIAGSASPGYRKRRSCGAIHDWKHRCSTVTRPSFAGPPRGVGRRGTRSRGREAYLDHDSVARRRSGRGASRSALRTWIDNQAKRRRQSLATPRGLPAPPASFRNVSRETPRKLFATPSHPALKRSSPVPNRSATNEPPATPLDDIKRRLSLLQRQSATAPSRRANVSFGLPSTPSARGVLVPSSSYTVASKRPTGSSFLFNKSRPQPALDEEEEQEDAENDAAVDDMTPSRTRNDNRRSTPVTPIVQPIPGSAVSSLHVTPVPIPAQTPTVALRDVLPLPEDITSTSFISASSSSETVASSSPAPSPAQQALTPDFSAIKKMVYAPLPPKTPNFAGIKQMYPELPAPPKTPDFTGLKHMYPAHAPRTPRFGGMREMLAEPAQEASSPDLGGLGDMYAADEDVEDDVTGEDQPMVIEQNAKDNNAEATMADEPTGAAAKKPSASGTSRARKTATATAKIAAMESSKIGDVDVAVPTRTRHIVKPTVARTRKAAVPAGAVDTDAKSTSSRTRRAPTEEVATAGPSTRTRRAPTVEQVEQEVPSKPSTSKTRTTKKAEAAAPADEAASRPSRASRATGKKTVEKVVLGEAFEQPTVDAEALSKPSKRKATTAPATTSSESTSVPARRTRAKVDKENEPEVPADVKAPAEKKAPVRRAATKKAAEVDATPVSAPSTRSTRSRK